MGARRGHCCVASGAGKELAARDWAGTSDPFVQVRRSRAPCWPALLAGPSAVPALLAPAALRQRRGEGTRPALPALRHVCDDAARRSRTAEARTARAPSTTASDPSGESRPRSKLSSPTARSTRATALLRGRRRATLCAHVCVVVARMTPCRSRERCVRAPRNVRVRAGPRRLCCPRTPACSRGACAWTCGTAA